MYELEGTVKVNRSAVEGGVDSGRPDAHESAWLAAMDALDPATEVAPGVTVGEVREFATRPATPPGATFTLRATYGTAGVGGRPLTMSLYGRARPTDARPVVLFVHGGGWAGGDPYWHIRHCHALAAEGYVTATLGYRLLAEAPWPAALEDVKAAVRWVRSNARRIGADPHRIAMAGGSAGAQLAAMTALTPGQFEGGGGSSGVPSDIQAAILWYPPTDLARLEFPSDQQDVRAAVEAYFGDRCGDVYRVASPIHHVSSAAPPTMTMTGTEDPLVPLATVREFHARLDDRGVSNRLHEFDGRGHAFDLVDPVEWAACYELMTSFLGETFVT